MLITPLEQFEIISLIPIKLLSLDFSITNLFLISLLTLGIFNSIVFFFSSNIRFFEEKSYFFIPYSWQFIVETSYETVSKLLFNNINIEGEKSISFIFSFFIFIGFQVFEYLGTLCYQSYSVFESRYFMVENVWKTFFVIYFVLFYILFLKINTKINIIPLLVCDEPVDWQTS